MFKTHQVEPWATKPRKRKGYSCQCITHFGCLWSENREKTFKFVITFHQQATDRLPTSYRHITNCRPTVGGLSADCRPTGSLYFGQNLLAVWRPTVGQQSADCWSTHGRQSANSRPTVGRQTADSWPTVDRQVFWGGLLHNYQFIDTALVVELELHKQKAYGWK